MVFCTPSLGRSNAFFYVNGGGFSVPLHDCDISQDPLGVFNYVTTKIDNYPVILTIKGPAYYDSDIRYRYKIILL